MKHLLAIALLFGAATAVPGQKIWLSNPSFEDAPASGYTPRGWENCGSRIESPPDVQPGQFSVTKSAKAGNTYLGLVVRDNESWESVSQRLRQPLEKGKTYTFTVYLAQAPRYFSASRRTNEPADYVTPARLWIWGGDDPCDFGELLAESTPVDHEEWLAYEFKLAPTKGNWSYIVLQAAYVGDEKPGFKPYNGHILIDDCSEIAPIDR